MVAGLLTAALVLVAVALVGAVCEVMLSVGYCMRRRVFWRVHPAGLTAAGRHLRTSADRQRVPGEP